MLMPGKTQRKTRDIDPRSSTDFDKQIGLLVRDRRISMGLTQVDVAKLLGVGQSQFNKYEMGDNRIPASRLVQLADVLQLPVTHFLRVSSTETRERSSPQLKADDRALLDVARQLSSTQRAQLLKIARILLAERS
jgi:transcriptional regulator with XRE-family HTH domain